MSPGSVVRFVSFQDPPRSRFAGKIILVNTPGSCRHAVSFPVIWRRAWSAEVDVLCLPHDARRRNAGVTREARGLLHLMGRVTELHAVAIVIDSPTAHCVVNCVMYLPSVDRCGVLSAERRFRSASSRIRRPPSTESSQTHVEGSAVASHHPLTRRIRNSSAPRNFIHMAAAETNSLTSGDTETSAKGPESRSNIRARTHRTFFEVQNVSVGRRIATIDRNRVPPLRGKGAQRPEQKAKKHVGWCCELVMERENHLRDNVNLPTYFFFSARAR